MGPSTVEAPAGAAGTLRAFLERPETSHALVLTGVRTSAQAVARELWGHAQDRGRLFVLVGRRLLPHPRGEPGPLPSNSLLHLPDLLLGDATWERRVTEAVDQARLRGYRGLTLLLAPGQHVAGGPLGVDAALEAAGLHGGSDRFCLYPRAWLRRHGPAEAVDLVRSHDGTLVLP